MMKRAFTARERALVIILCILLLFAAYYLLVHRNVIDSIAEIEAEKDLQQTNLMVTQTKVQKMKMMENELAEIEASGFKSMVPDYDNLSKEIVFLNNTLGGTTDYTINFASVTTTENIVRRVANISFTSQSYASCCSIIKKLQNCQYCCRLGDVLMQPIKEYNTQYSYDYDFDADYSILRNPLTVSVTMTFYERVAE